MSFGVDIYIYTYATPPGKSTIYPIPSMYGIFTYIWLIFMVNVGKNTIILWVYTYMFLLIHIYIYILGCSSFAAILIPDFTSIAPNWNPWRGWVHIPKMYGLDVPAVGSGWINGLFHLATWKGKSSEPNLHELGFKIIIFPRCITYLYIGICLYWFFFTYWF